MDDSKLQHRTTPKNPSVSQPSSTNSSISDTPNSTQRTATRSSPATAPAVASTSGPLVVSRPPLNVYLKIAVVRSPHDVVLCEDPERPGKTKQLVVGSLAERRRPEDDRPKADIEQRTAVAAAAADDDDDDKRNKTQNSKKTEIPVPTITTVKRYARDVPPTYQIPQSYIRYNHASYEEVDEAVEYNIDEDDENWWRADSEFGPDSKPKIVWENARGETVDTDESVSMLTMRDVLLQNPRYLLSSHGTNWIIRKFRPRLPLLVLEQMMDVLDKATGFETIVTVAQAEKILIAKIPCLTEIFDEKEPVIEKSRFVDRAEIVGQSTATTGADSMDKNPTARRIPAFAAPITLSAAIHRVYNYWMQKRSRLKKPLLRRFWPVTSISDLNPHMVFRPREKEKRKLRKKRQNDLESYKKMKMLKSDFEKVKTLCDLIVRREGVTSLMVDLTNEYYQQRMYEWLDTSGEPRPSRVLNRQIVERVLDVPKYFDDGPIVKVSKSKKRKRSLGMGASVLEMDQSTFHAAPSTGETVTAAPADEKSETSVVIAGHDGGLPAPSFLDPLASRERFVANWEDEVPFVPYYENGKRVATSDFRLR
ncbi:hypothetical protein HJC23_009292 [Cyclotella cryptica]|uniref:Enhancer of polycomb-like protein n=1 Tax=Cyclotella cryptica TaxID=29204 RepID=A0ABD3QS82_9STRA